MRCGNCLFLNVILSLITAFGGCVAYVDIALIRYVFILPFVLFLSMGKDIERDRGTSGEPPQPQSMTRVFGKSAHRKDPSFREKWDAAVQKKNSVLCAGLDLSDFAMGREEGLGPDDNRRDWALAYINAVGPYAAALKVNQQYWRGVGDGEALQEIHRVARELELLVIEDAKLADIGSSNDAGMFYAALRSDAVTLAPFAGNMEEAAEQARER